MNFSAKRGFLQLLLIIIIAIAVISYFKIDLRALLESAWFKNNLSYAWQLVVKIWEWLKTLWS